MTTHNSITGDAPFASIERHQVEQRAKSGAHWFYWIAALSLITSIVALSGSNWGFFASLGITQMVDGYANLLAARLGGSVKVVAFVFDLVAAGLFALIGLFAARRHAWVFVAGMALYVLDSLVFVLARHWLGLAFHAYVIYSIFGGYKACARLAEMDREAGVGGAYDAPPAPAAPVTESAR